MPNTRTNNSRIIPKKYITVEFPLPYSGNVVVVWGTVVVVVDVDVVVDEVVVVVLVVVDVVLRVEVVVLVVVVDVVVSGYTVKFISRETPP